MDASGHPLTNVSGFAKTLDFIEIMNYDVWGPWSSSVGPNAPLDDYCVATSKRQGSATAAVKAWTKAGMPAHQINLGAASYGHSFRVTSSNATKNDTLIVYPPFDKSKQPVGDVGMIPQVVLMSAEMHKLQEVRRRSSN